MGTASVLATDGMHARMGRAPVRQISNAPIPGFDLAEQVMAVLALLRLSYCQREGGHIRTDLLIGRRRGRPQRIAAPLSIPFMPLLTNTLTHAAWGHILRSFGPERPLGSRSPDIAPPLWPSNLVVKLSLALPLLRLALQVPGLGRAMREGSAAAVAVPLIGDPATVAQGNTEAVDG